MLRFFLNPIILVSILIPYSVFSYTPTVASLNVYTLIPCELHTPERAIKKTVSLNRFVDLIQQKRAPLRCILKMNTSSKKLYAYKGIVQEPLTHNTIFICSRGYAKRDVKLPYDDLELVKQGGGIIAAHMMYKDNIITNAPAVTFDFPDERSYFNFGQHIDIACLKMVIDEVRKAHPHAQLVGLGDCRGAKALLAYAAQEPDTFAALVLISPFVSTLDMIAQLSKNYLSWLPQSYHLLHSFFQFYFPSYDVAQETVLADAIHINTQLPIFIGQRKNDYLASDKSIRQLVTTLQQAGNTNIRLTMVSDNKATHSRITPIPALQRAVRQFLIDYNLC